jgi:sarcosine oxidase
MRSTDFDVIVCGLGAMGSATLLHLADRGHRVLGVDRFAPPHDRGSSHGRTRVIREAYFEHPVYVPLVQRAMSLWEALEERSGHALLRTTGALMLGPPGSRTVEGALRSAAEHGLPHERLTWEAVRRRFPAFHADDGVEGVWEPRAGALAVEACVQTQLGLARGAGARVHLDEPMLEWSPAGDGVEVRTASGRYAAGALVLALGAWLPEWMPRLPLEVERQVQLWFAPAADPALLRPGAFPVFIWERDDGATFYGLPDMGGGVKVARHRDGEATTAAELRRVVDEADVAEVRAFLAERIPAADGPLRDACVCPYTNTPDHHFLLDRHPEHPQVWLVSPCSGHGFKFAPAIGELVAGWVESGTAPPELAPFRLRR